MKLHGLWCHTLQTCWVTSGMRNLRRLLTQLVLSMHVVKELTFWGLSMFILSYVKTNVKLINLLSAQTISHSKSITIWPATAQLCHPASLWHNHQSRFHESHPELSVNCEGDQETSHHCDRNCQICHAGLQLLLWNSSSELIKVHPAAHWVLGFSIHVAGIRASITGGEGAAVSQAIWWKENIADLHPSHLLEAQNQV